MNPELEQQLKNLPTDPGIYQYFDSSNELIYVGKAVNLKNRVKSYFSGLQSPKTQVLVAQIDHLATITVQSEMDALILEANLIKEHKPRYNIILKDDKTHLYIKITLYEDLPRVSTCRGTDVSLDPKATYFGPYPSSGMAKRTLRFLRRVFPYVAKHQPPMTGRRRPPQSFFYYNLPLGQVDAVIDQKRYRQQIFQLVRFLSGQRQQVATELEKDMRQAAKSLDFELAAALKQQLEGITYVTQLSITPETYVSNPELVAEKRAEGLMSLAHALSAYFPSLQQEPIAKPSPMLYRVECYDISNISGQQAVGSMVVFELGESKKSDYRKFKIKLENKPNDYAMMQEVLSRRFKRLKVESDMASSDTSFSSMPSLIVIDGGKGQLTAALATMSELGLSIPIVGMTKREEELVIAQPGTVSHSSELTSSYAGKAKRSAAHGAIARTQEEATTQTLSEATFTIIRLARGSEALFFLQRLRDEAHRFAITYHRQLRAKAFLPTNPK